MDNGAVRIQTGMQVGFPVLAEGRVSQLRPSRQPRLISIAVELKGSPTPNPWDNEESLTEPFRPDA